MIVTNLIGRRVRKAEHAAVAAGPDDTIYAWPFGPDDEAEVVAAFALTRDRPVGLVVHLHCASLPGSALWATLLESCALVEEPVVSALDKQRAIRAELLRSSITVLDLSVRTATRLKGQGILVIEDLVTRTESSLSSLRGFRPVAMKEITQKLAKHGLALADA